MKLKLELNENGFWASVWVCVLLAFCTLVGGLLAYNVSADRAVAEMVTKGADPVAAACAVDRRATVCALARSAQ